MAWLPVVGYPDPYDAYGLTGALASSPSVTFSGQLEYDPWPIVTFGSIIITGYQVIGMKFPGGGGSSSGGTVGYAG